ncbi:enoyl-CoA hydratase [Denitrobaculum tricleocarpae]|uniref:Enoyl-CoA hydratase domain-containing protein 3, mitochondrial n=1 Tax=Denitrobaculum tricleocarpae TaxID=2591009 RepID=A0A545TT75_9PROT|nr:enoyl-CoA hydratase [Denitrobaculum tricleocarpae]TQV80424.1 enoyl-CoA hydratase [Denitrobaculum tricleocarpae]
MSAVSASDAVSNGTASNDEAILLRSDSDGIATLTLNRPKQYNALSTGLMSEVQAALDDLREDHSVKVAILEASGKGFCAGHDLKEMRAGDGRTYFEAVFKQCSRMMLAITRLPQPVIAKVHGIATAAGCQLVATCDLAVASNDAHFATPGVNIGLFCSTPMVALSRAVGRKTAMEMLLTGEGIDAATAERMGLINRAVPPGELDRITLEYAEKIASKSPLTLKIGKEAFYRQIEMDLEQAYNYASEVMTTNMLARDAEEGIDAFIEKRDPKWTGE